MEVMVAVYGGAFGLLSLFRQKKVAKENAPTREGLQSLFIASSAATRRSISVIFAMQGF
jgi:hypothetical protein